MRLDKKYKAVCFDMDGTLLDTKVDYAKIANLVFDEMIAIGVPESVINRDQGMKFNLESGIDYLKNEGRMGDVFNIGNKVAEIANDVELETVGLSKTFECSLEVLQRIHSRGLKTGILTRGCREYAVTACRICGILSEIDEIVARDDYPIEDSKPSGKAMEHIAERLGVKTSEILFLGDHLFDYQCAHDAGTDFIPVLSGVYDKKDWEDAGLENYIKSIDEFCRNIE